MGVVMGSVGGRTACTPRHALTYTRGRTWGPCGICGPHRASSSPGNPQEMDRKCGHLALAFMHRSPSVINPAC